MMKRMVFQVLLAGLALLPAGPGGAVLAQDEAPPDARALLADLKSNVEQIMPIVNRGLEVQAARDSNRREMAAVEAEGRSLEREKADIDRLRADYDRDIAAFQGDCVGKRLTPEQLSDCNARGARMNSRAAELEQRAGAINPRVAEFNARIDAFNRRDRELEQEEQGLNTQYLPYARRIDQLKSALTAQARQNGKAQLIENIGKCNQVDDFEDIYTCMEFAWRRELR